MLSEKVLQVLENHNVRISDEPCQHGDGSICWELEWYSPAGEDCIWVIDGDSDELFVEDFKAYAEDFDADEHAEQYIDSRGQNGIPDSIRVLIDDADAIKSKLEEIAEELDFII